MTIKCTDGIRNPSESLKGCRSQLCKSSRHVHVLQSSIRDRTDWKTSVCHIPKRKTLGVSSLISGLWSPSVAAKSTNNLPEFKSRLHPVTMSMHLTNLTLDFPVWKTGILMVSSSSDCGHWNGSAQCLIAVR